VNQAADSIDSFQTSRLRPAEWLLGAAALVLLLSTFFVDWYGLRAELALTFGGFGRQTSFSAWDILSITRYFLIATGLLGLAVFYVQASRRAPALPVALTVILNPLALITTLLVFHRVVISKPGAGDLLSLRAGAIVGLISCVTLMVAAYGSLRGDGIREIDGPGEIETFRQRPRRRPVEAT
jgi:hypothetical protein